MPLPSGAHKWYIADAGGNDIISVSSKGNVSTVAVLPPQPFVVTAEAAAGVGLPDCTIGLTYNFEPVPTDVEVSNSGILYVTTLPGGPEDPSLGRAARCTRSTRRAVMSRWWPVGFLGATNLALGKRGSDLRRRAVRWAGVEDRRRSPADVIELPQPAGLEFANGKLYVSYDVFGPSGKVATISL